MVFSIWSPELIVGASHTKGKKHSKKAKPKKRQTAKAKSRRKTLVTLCYVFLKPLTPPISVTLMFLQSGKEHYDDPMKTSCSQMPIEWRI